MGDKLKLYLNNRTGSLLYCSIIESSLIYILSRKIGSFLKKNCKLKKSHTLKILENKYVFPSSHGLNVKIEKYVLSTLHYNSS